MGCFEVKNKNVIKVVNPPIERGDKTSLKPKTPIKRKDKDKKLEKPLDLPKDIPILIDDSVDPIPIQKPIYDAVFSCESLDKLKYQGWHYSVSLKFKKRFEKPMLDEDDKKDEELKICPLCMLGDSNKGKTFILSLLTDNQLKSGDDFKTIGISCKLSDFVASANSKNKKEKFLLFDSAGRSEPLLIEPEEKKKLNDDELKTRVELNNRDLKISGEFMKNFLIINSKIIIVVVNQLSLSEQLFLYELKSERHYEELFIIHNLYNFKTREDIEGYINNTIINSIYFDISKDYFQIIKKEEIQKGRPYYFKEEQSKGNDKALIAHLILGDWETKIPWIQHFNKKTISFLKNRMQLCLAKDYFQFEKLLEKELLNQNQIPDKSELKKERNENNNSGYDEEGILKLKEEKLSVSRRNDTGVGVFIDTEFSVMKYTPTYIYNREENNFVIEIECAGIYDNNISITAKTQQGKVYFTAKGKKKYPRELGLEDKPFYISFSVNTEKEKFEIVTNDSINRAKPTFQKGIYRKEFPIRDINDEPIEYKNTPTPYN